MNNHIHSTMNLHIRTRCMTTKVWYDISSMKCLIEFCLSALHSKFYIFRLDTLTARPGVYLRVIQRKRKYLSKVLDLSIILYISGKAAFIWQKLIWYIHQIATNLTCWAMLWRIVSCRDEGHQSYSIFFWLRDIFKQCLIFMHFWHTFHTCHLSIKVGPKQHYIKSYNCRRSRVVA